jgi:invasion protein IalB
MQTPLFLRSLFICLALALVAITLPNDARAQTAVKKSFGEWQYTCPAGKDAKCALVQQRAIKDKNTGELGTVLSIGLAVTDDKKAKMTIGGPLGVELTQGMLVKIDGGKAIRVPFNQCIQLGCLAVVNVADDFLDVMRRGSTLSVTFLPYGGKQGMTVEASLSGFTAGYNALSR